MTSQLDAPPTAPRKKMPIGKEELTSVGVALLFVGGLALCVVIHLTGALR